MADECAPEVTEQADQLDTTETQTEPAQPDPSEPFTTTRQAITDLRDEAKGHREKAQALATRLHTELVRQTGRLADPTELPFDTAHLDDPDALKAAIDELLTRKPHYAARTPQGNTVGQGVKDQAQATDWLSQLKTLV
ncbi:hypothetical protein A5626_09575 [Mycobacterium marseillense]|jgi:hypothetical protein|uniref:hypothetical protein n=1 Tax=Mycobacterium marseillense TaxID=701042 RepID=UPI0007FDA240|nr:hypothetical protein [Mycobacterium marseillense]MCA2261983.1 hypothetical protein [Mycobacterium marseillense]OBJ66830.1 hypothetical protein A5626_09575 [Mycobacterium marseillense]